MDLDRHFRPETSKLEAAFEPANVPGSNAENPIQEQHPDLSTWERAKISNFAPEPATGKRRLEELGFEVKDRGGWDMSIRKPGGKWHAFNPKGFDWRDLLGYGGDVGEGVATGAGAVVGAGAGLPGGPVGAIAGGALGAGAAAHGARNLRSLIGTWAGLSPTPEETGGAAGESALVGAASVPILAGAGYAAKPAVKFLGKGIEKLGVGLGLPEVGVRKYTGEAAREGLRKEARELVPGEAALREKIRGLATERGALAGEEAATAVERGAMRRAAEKEAAQQAEEAAAKGAAPPAEEPLIGADAFTKPVLEKEVGQLEGLIARARASGDEDMAKIWEGQLAKHKARLGGIEPVMPEGVPQAPRPPAMDLFEKAKKPGGVPVEGETFSLKELRGEMPKSPITELGIPTPPERGLSFLSDVLHPATGVKAKYLQKIPEWVGIAQKHFGERFRSSLGSESMKEAEKYLGRFVETKGRAAAETAKEGYYRDLALWLQKGKLPPQIEKAAKAQIKGTAGQVEKDLLNEALAQRLREKAAVAARGKQVLGERIQRNLEARATLKEKAQALRPEIEELGRKRTVLAGKRAALKEPRRFPQAVRELTSGIKAFLGDPLVFAGKHVEHAPEKIASWVKHSPSTVAAKLRDPRTPVRLRSIYAGALKAFHTGGDSGFQQKLMEATLGPQAGAGKEEG